MDLLGCPLGYYDYLTIVAGILLLAEIELVEAKSQVSENLVALYKGLGGGW